MAYTPEEGDELRSCIEEGCGASFIIKADEREWYRAQGFDLPKRCKPCRAQRKAAKASQLSPPPARSTVDQLGRPIPVEQRVPSSYLGQGPVNRPKTPPIWTEVQEQ
jgi:hypothetical protein